MVEFSGVWYPDRGYPWAIIAPVESGVCCWVQRKTKYLARDLSTTKTHFWDAVQECQADSSPSIAPPQLAGWAESARRDRPFETWALLMDECRMASKGRSEEYLVSQVFC